MPIEAYKNLDGTFSFWNTVTMTWISSLLDGEVVEMGPAEARAFLVQKGFTRETALEVLAEATPRAEFKLFKVDMSRAERIPL